MDEIERSIGRLEGKVESMILLVSGIDKKVDNLPCASHSQRLETIEQWKKISNGESQTVKMENLRGGISLKVGLIIGTMTFIFGILLTIFTNFVMR